MKIIYSNKKVEKQCSSIKEAKKLFGGSDILVENLMSKINIIKNAEVLKDIIVMPPMHFHKLNGKLNGFFAVDVKSRRDKWRIIIQPLDEFEGEYIPCNIDEIAEYVRIVRIEEVSQHYE